MFISNISLFVGDMIFILSEFYFFFIIIFSLCIGLFLNNHVKSLNINKLIIELTLPLLLINFLFFYYLLNLDLIIFFNFKLDNFYLFFKIIIYFFLIFFFIVSKNYFILEKIKIFEYSILILLSIQGLLLVLFTVNLFIMYIALEIQNLCFYVLASLKRFNNFSVEAGLKYFLLGSLSSSLLLFGISLLYGLLGTLDIFDIYFILLNFNYEIFFILILLSLFFFLCGLFFKLGSVPFHWWLPDVYEGSPTVIMLFFSIMPKILLIFLLIKFYFFIFFFELRLNFIFLILGFFSIIVGGLNAMYQSKIKRFLAYSTIVNIGFILIALSIFTIEGMFSSIFYLICYIFSIFSFFLILLNFKKNHNIEFLKLIDLSFLNYNVLLLFFISIIFFSFIGLPPFLGFFGKLFIYFNLLSNYNYFILLILMFLSIIIGFYYLRVVRFLFFFNFNLDKKNIINLKFNNIFSIYFLLNIYFLCFFDFFCESINYILIYTFLII